jgi:hypothetical protein
MRTATVDEGAADMSYIPRDNSKRVRATLRAVEPPRAAVRQAHGGLPEVLFTSLTATVFLVLIASVAAAAILYSQGT